MKAGKIAHWERLQFKVAVQNAIVLENVLPFTYRYRANLNSYSAVSPTETLSAISMFAERSGVLDGINNQQHAGISVTLYGTTLYEDLELDDDPNPHVSLLFDNFKLYCVPVEVDEVRYLTWLAQADAVIVETHEGIVHTGGFWSIQTPMPERDYFCPASVPLLGIPPELQANTSNFFGTEIVSPTGGSTVSFGAIGGWRFREPGSENWTELPVQLDIQEAQVSGCCAFPASPPAISATSTWNASITPTAARTHTVLTGNTYLEFKHGAVSLVPNLARNWKLQNDGASNALVRQFARPATVAREHTVCLSANELSQTTCDLDEIVDTTIYLSRSASVERWSAHQTEPSPVYAPHRWTHVREVYPLGETTVYFDKRRTDVEFPICSHDLHDYYDHADDRVRYLNTWCNPHWSAFYLFDDWQLGLPLTPVAKQDYWLPARQQWMNHAELPEFDRTERRIDIIDAPMLDSPRLSSWIDDRFFNAFMFTHWAGITRFDVDIPARSESIALHSESEGSWSISGASASFGSVIELTLSGTTCTLQLDLGQFERVPFLYPHWSDRIACLVESAHLVSATLSLVNRENESWALGAADGEPVALPAVNDGFYAGSWSQDYSAGLAGYSEFGSDLQVAGVSADVMSDREGRLLFELFRGGHARYLRIDIELSAAGTATVHYPVFYHDLRSCRAYPELANVQAVLNSGNRFLRFGTLDMSSHPPAIRNYHQSPTAFDYQRFKNMIWSGIDGTDMSVWYDDVELDTDADAQTDTRVFAYTLRTVEHEPPFLLVNAFRECPALAVCPRRARDEQLIENGDWTQTAYLWTSRYRYFINQSEPVYLYRVDFDVSSETGRVRLCEDEIPFYMWHVTRFGAGVENDEVIVDWDGNSIHTPRWYIAHNVAGDLGRVTPFHGYLSVCPQGGKPGVWISYDISASGRHIRAFTDDGIVWLGLARDRTAQLWLDQPTSVAGERPCVRWLNLQRLDAALAVTDSATIRIYFIDERGNIKMSITVGNGDYAAIVATRDGRLFVYYYRDSAIRGRIYDQLGNALTAEFTAVATADESAIAADEYVLQPAGWRINLLYRRAGALTVATSVDGVTFI